jgi:hypothetical protein
MSCEENNVVKEKLHLSRYLKKNQKEKEKEKCRMGCS